MSTEKRFLLALSLTLGFLYLWSAYLAPKPVTPPPGSAPQETAAATASPAAVKASQTPEKAPAAAAVRTEKETAFLSMVWTNQPGAPENVSLKKYRTESRKEAPAVHVIPFQENAPPPLRWSFESNGRVWNDDGAVYRQVPAETPDAVAYERTLDRGLSVRKVFKWNPESYLIEARVSVVNRGPSPVKLKAAATVSAAETPPKPKSFLSGLGAHHVPLRMVAYINEKAVHWTMKDVAAKRAIPTGDIRWAGFDDQYFLLAVLPIEGRWAEIQMDAEGHPGRADLTAVYPLWEVAPGTSQVYGLNLFAGPKELGALSSAGASLERAIDLGDWLGWIARPILGFLRGLHSVFKNYGVAIILLTALVRLLMFPLTQMQAKSMRRMQEHKPQMDALKEKYKDDKESYSRELMMYMRTHRINPMGGCLLLLPQLPIFFALYRVLYNSIELRQAPFVFWIRDLAAHDPFFVLPILLGIAMFFQQKLTPSPGADPAQQAMMKFMPVLFTFLMLFLPAGLNLYIFVSTLWGVAQQYWVQRNLAPVAVLQGKANGK